MDREANVQELIYRAGIRRAGPATPLQQLVYDAVVARGYRQPETLTAEAFIGKQLDKAVEELGEVFRHKFDGQLPPVEELADVVIPLFAAAAEMGEDLERAIKDKVQSDVARGVR